MYTVRKLYRKFPEINYFSNYKDLKNVHLILVKIIKSDGNFLDKVDCSNRYYTANIKATL